MTPSESPKSDAAPNSRAELEAYSSSAPKTLNGADLETLHEPGKHWRRWRQHYQEEYAQRVRWLVYARVLLFVLLLTATLFSNWPWPRADARVMGLLGVFVSLAFFYAAILPFIERLERFVLIQVCIDMVCEAVLVHFTAGVFQPTFTLLHFFSVIMAALLISRNAALLCASFCTVTLAVNVGLYDLAFNNFISLPWLPAGLLDFAQEHWSELVRNLVSLALALHIVAWLTSYLPFRVTGVNILFEEILSQIREGVLAIDNTGRIVYANKEARALLQWEAIPGLEERRFPDALHREKDRRILEVLTAGSNIHGEIELPIRGQQVPVEMKTSVLRDSKGRVRGVVGLVADKTLQRKVEDVQKRLEKLRGLEVMALGMAHEIRNPLSSIRGAMQALKERAFEDEDDRLLADIVLKESDRLDSILRDFMDFASEPALSFQAVNMKSLVQEVITLLSYREDAEGVDIQLKECQGSQVVMLDVHKFKQVLINLGVNALEAMALDRAERTGDQPEGAEKSDRSCRLWFKILEGRIHHSKDIGPERHFQETQALAVVIEDNGPGIARELHSKLFTPFFSTKQRGTGLGLAVAQKIINTHGGDISCESEDGQGSTFVIKLPRPPTAEE